MQGGRGSSLMRLEHTWVVSYRLSISECTCTYWTHWQGYLCGNGGGLLLQRQHNLPQLHVEEGGLGTWWSRCETGVGTWSGETQQSCFVTRVRNGSPRRRVTESL